MADSKSLQLSGYGLLTVTCHACIALRISLYNRLIINLRTVISGIIKFNINILSCANIIFGS